MLVLVYSLKDHRYLYGAVVQLVERLDGILQRGVISMISVAFSNLVCPK